MKHLLKITFFIALCSFSALAQKKPNVIVIYADDLGIGDLSSYGATKLHTPNIDKLAARGVRFTNARTTSATCTPSRFGMMTGKYPWRQTGTGVLPGDAKLIIPTDEASLATVFKDAGYTTGMVGKWHLGLGTQVEKDWNQPISPGPNEVGFDYSFIFPATEDRVPTVFMENHDVIALDPNDPIEVNYKHKIGNEPTGKENPELLKMKASPNHGHDMTIVNNVGRIGWKKGGKMTSWVDEEIPFTFLYKAEEFIEKNQEKPFFLMYCLTEPHVPRVPATIFKGKSGLGFRGDAILEVDWAVGEILKQLKYLDLDENTIIVFSSDNGPVLDDGYQDGAVTQLNGHTPWGIYRGGKYSILEAGTRVPMIVSWPKGIKKASVSDALFSQIDLLASFADYLHVPVNDKKDSRARFEALIGKSSQSRSSVIVDSHMAKAIIKGDWKYVEPSGGVALMKLTNIESGWSDEDKLYNLKEDPKEEHNLAKENPKKLAELKAEFDESTKMW
ncbi:arylsulfatase [Marinilongibacter aquaticus]|uniref:sulfatase family protein n=1 Tax=Marinilongibacter aquaticus TaxID=2975157 RepID=UPI0021BD6EBE|nr:arylsulfatase [Marinilongibacter aquaticus]UBM57755.1 arylsulfatase [Marinilongibacter aquaticus]